MKTEIQIEFWPTHRHFIVNVGDERRPELDYIRGQFTMFYGDPIILVESPDDVQIGKDGIESIQGQHPILWAREIIDSEETEKELERRIFAAWESDHP